MRTATAAALLAALPLALGACGGSEDTAQPGLSPAAEAPPTQAVEPELSASPTVEVPAAAEAMGGQATPVDELQPGDCFDDVEPALNEVSEVTVVPCDQPHDNEVFALLEQPDGEFPGAEDIQGMASEGCFAEFEPYVGSEFGTSTLDVFPITPTAASWEQGDRRVVCVVTSAEPRTGSAAGSGA